MLRKIFKFILVVFIFSYIVYQPGWAYSSSAHLLRTRAFAERDEGKVRLIGGKGLGLTHLKRLAKKLGFKVPNFEILDTTIFDAYNKQKRAQEANLIDEHQKEIAQGFVKAYRRATTIAQKERALRKLEKGELSFLIAGLGIQHLEEMFLYRNPYDDNFKDEASNTQDFTFNILHTEMLRRRQSVLLPKEIRRVIGDKTRGLKGKIKVRSSGVAEDSFIKSLAGRYRSLTVRDRKKVNQAVLKIYLDFFTKRESHKDKVAVILQDYIEADSGGIAFSSLLGMTTIEAVIGSPETAVEGGSSIVIDMDGDDIDTITYGFQELPDEVILRGQGLEFKHRYAVWSKKTHMVRTKNSGKKKCPLSEPQIKEVARVVRALERELGYAVDIEFAFKRNRLYVLQVRPITGRDKGLADALPRFANKDIIARVPIAINPIDYRGRLAIIEHLDSTQKGKRLRQLQKRFGTDLILVTEMPEHVIYKPGMVTVMIDPYHANRITHQGVVLREEGDTTYLGCPGLLPLLEEAVNFHIVGKSWKGWLDGKLYAEVKLSDQPVRIISNGLRAIIVKATAKPLRKQYKSSSKPTKLNELTPLLDDALISI